MARDLDWVPEATPTVTGCTAGRATSAEMIVGKLTVATKSDFVTFTTVKDTRPGDFTAGAIAVDIELAATRATAMASKFPGDVLSAEDVLPGFAATDTIPRVVPAQDSFRATFGVSPDSVSPGRDPQVVMASS